MSGSDVTVDPTKALLQALTQLTENLKNKPDDAFTGFKANLKPIPVLHDELEWSEWIIKVKDAIKLMKYGPMLVDANAMQDKWDFVRVWLCQYLNRTDTHIANKSKNLLEALEGLGRIMPRRTTTPSSSCTKDCMV
jgi:hypothetical protein